MMFKGAGSWESALDAKAFAKRRWLGDRIFRVLSFLANRGRHLETLTLKESRYLDFISHYLTTKVVGPMGYTRIVLKAGGSR